mmetsp:Transcript_9954/g.22250  ORF Transcript_9954/g.22250 Transcript_9954/m.22250 type:complete len:504 (+) Transcript_9954:88-1599(+)
MSSSPASRRGAKHDAMLATRPPRSKRSRAQTDDSSTAASADAAAVAPVCLTMLPTEVWARILPFLPFDDGLKQCTVSSKYFFGLAPTIAYPDDFTLKITITSDVVRLVPLSRNPIWSTFLTAEQKRVLKPLVRFRNVKCIKIVEYKQHTVKPQVLETILSSFPVLAKLTIVGLDSDEGYLHTNGLYYGEQYVGNTSRSLTNAFATVGSTLQYLSLDRCYLSPPIVIPSLHILPHLATLKLVMTMPMISVDEAEWFHDDDRLALIRDNRDDLLRLGRHIGERLARWVPRLQELMLTSDEESREASDYDTESFQFGLALGCSGLRNLRILRSLYLVNDKFSTDACPFAGAFARMMCGLESLEEISIVRYPNHVFWRRLSEIADARTFPLKKLSCFFLESGQADFEIFVEVLLRHFPLLTELEVELSSHLWFHERLNTCSNATAVQVLGRLRGHPTLRKIMLCVHGWDISRDDTHTVMTSLDERVGEHIQVVESDLKDGYWDHNVG